MKIVIERAPHDVPTNDGEDVRVWWSDGMATPVLIEGRHGRTSLAESLARAAAEALYADMLARLSQ